MSAAFRPISARTALCGILLHPAGHTRSPAMHAAAYAALGIDAVYLAFDVPPARLADAMLRRARARRATARDLAAAQAGRAGARRRAGRDRAPDRRGEHADAARATRWLGSNTDWLGAVRALESERRLDGARAVVLGAGGTARAVVFGLLERGARVHVLNRSPERARRLARRARRAGVGRARRSREHAARRAREHDLRRPARGRLAGRRRRAARGIAS